jgi:hypothetical protein
MSTHGKERKSVDNDEQVFREVRRQTIIERAVEAADRIIMDGSDGTVEETNFLTARVAHAYMEKALNPHNMALVKKDLGL